MSTITMAPGRVRRARPQRSRLSTIAADAKQDAAQNKDRRGAVKWARRVFAVIALMFALMSLNTGSAQAWPWSGAEKKIGSYITNICGPYNIGKWMVASDDGLSHTLSLSLDSKGKVVSGKDADPGQATYLPADPGDAIGPSAQQRLNKAYAKSAPGVQVPTYSRYGFDTLQWTSYGGGCFGVNLPATYIMNGLFWFMVKWPVMICITLLNFCLSTWLPAAAAALMAPLFGALTAVPEPYWAFLILIGGILTWWRGRGSLQALLKYAVFALTCVGTMMWVGQAGGASSLVTSANNLVTKVVGGAACMVNNAGHQEAKCDANSSGNGLGSIDDTLWKGLAYAPWAAGEVGTQAAGSTGSPNAPGGGISWGAAMLNAMYYNPHDAVGRQEMIDVNAWDRASNDEDGNDGSKMKTYTNDRQFAKIGFLMNVRIMCHDSSKKGTHAQATGDNPNDQENWMYGDNCLTSNTDAKGHAMGDDTSDIVSNIKGNRWDQRFLICVTAGFGAYIVCSAILLIGMYVTVQRFLFLYLLIFTPLWLSIALIGDEKRKMFAKKFFEGLFSNLVKQILAIISLLILVTTIGDIMVPPDGSTMVGVPWIFKPFLMWMFVWAMILMFIPFMRLAKHVAKGNAEVVNKVNNAPQAAAKTTAKVAVQAGLLVATGGTGNAAMAAGKLGTMVGGGTGAAIAKGGAAIGKAGGIASRFGMNPNGGAMSRIASAISPTGEAGAGYMRMGRMLGGEKGQHLSRVGRVLSGMENINKNGAKTDAAERAKESAMFMFANEQNPDGTFKNAFERSKQTGALTPKGREQAMAAYEQKLQEQEKSQDLLKQNRAYFDNYRAENGGAYHEMDPRGKVVTPSERAAVMKFANEKDGDGNFKREYDRDGQGALTTGGFNKARADYAKYHEQQRGQRQYYDDYFQEHGSRHPDDTRNKDYRAAAEPGGSTAAGAGAAENTGSGENKPGAAAMPASGDMASAFVDPTPAATEAARATVENLVGQSAVMRSPDLVAHDAIAGTELMNQAGYTQQQIVDNPEIALDGLAYNNGSPYHMDPSHPATQPLTDLAFARAYGSQQDVAQATDAASAAIQQSGIPDEVVYMRSTGDMANSFHPAQVLDVMTPVTPDMPWQDRAEAAHVMHAAAATIPDGAKNADYIDRYADALGSPSVPAIQVEDMRVMAAEAFAQGFRDAARDVSNMEIPVNVVATGSGSMFEGGAHEQPADYGTPGSGSMFNEPAHERPANEQPADYGTPPDARPAYEAPAYEAPANERPANYGQPGSGSMFNEPVDFGHDDSYPAPPVDYGYDRSQRGGYEAPANEQPADYGTPPDARPANYGQPGYERRANERPANYAPASEAPAPDAPAQYTQGGGSSAEYRGAHESPANGSGGGLSSLFGPGNGNRRRRAAQQQDNGEPDEMMHGDEEEVGEMKPDTGNEDGPSLFGEDS